MRYLFASMLMCCCAAAGYSQDDTVATESPVEVTSTDEGAGNSDGNVAVGTDSKEEGKSSNGGCGCGKPKL
jgi:hypothetical protein